MIIKKLFSRLPITLFSLVFIATLSFSSHARQLGDVTLPDNVTLQGSDVALQLNGIGYRTKFIFKIYVGALYTESTVNSRDAAQALQGPKRVAMHMVYDEVARKKMVSAWNDGFEDNNSKEQLKKLQARLDTFVSYFPDLKEGDVVYLDYVPSIGTRVTIKGEEKGVIEGADFYTAVLDVWLGEDPADEGLKDAMLNIEDE